MKSIIIDAGGTSLKYSFLENGNIIDSKSMGPSNINNDFEGTYSLIEDIIKEKNLERGVFGISGYLALDNSRKNKLNKMILKHVKKIKIMSDAQLPLYSSPNKNVVSITCGTGTAILFKKDGVISDEEKLGFGWAICDPMSGFEIGRGILFNCLISGDESLINEVSSVLGVGKSETPIKYIWKNKENIQANIAKLSILLTSDNKKMKKLSTIVLNKNIEILISYLKTIIKKDDEILLNGGIFNNIPKAYSSIKENFDNKITLIKSNAIQSGIVVLKDDKLW